MHLDQFIAPEGFLTMRKGDIHHRLRTDPVRGRVLFAVFTPAMGVGLVVVEHLQLISALGTQVIPAPEPELVPPWLHHLESMDQIEELIAKAELVEEAERLSKQVERVVDPRPGHVQPAIDELQAAPDQTNSEITPAAAAEEPNVSVMNAARLVRARQCYVQSAIDDLKTILSADDPSKAINAYARGCEPPQNESRYRAWVYAYIAFGYNRAALFPRHHNRGRWNRLDPCHTQPQGRSGRSGGASRFLMTPELVKRINDAFTTHAKLGLTEDKVYARAMRKDFGCITQKVDGRTVLVHPEGKPVPNSNQFWYRCELKFGRDGIKKALRGEETYRNRDAASVGNYSMGVGNVLERVHTDVSHSKSHPKSYVGSGVYPKLTVCKIIDALSGMCIGVGGGYGTEDGRIYQEALFCAAIPKSLFGKLIGYEINDEEWPGHGLPTGVVADRGPGGAAKNLLILQEQGIARALTPTRSPQSNSVVESRHPRSPEIAGVSAFETSELTAIEMFKQEVELVMLANRSSAAVNRASNAQIGRGEVTPLAIYKDMLARLRTDARQIQVEVAVRAFLPEVEFAMRDGLLYLHNRVFGGPEFRKSVSQIDLRRLEGRCLKGHCLTISTRHAWVELGGRLIMVDALTPYRDGEEELYLTLDDLREVGARAAQLESARRADKPAEIAHSHERFEERTGVQFDAPTRRRGAKSPTTPAVKRELAALKK